VSPANTTCGRKHCSRCGRWRHGQDFRVHTWGDNGQPKRLHAECYRCTRQRKRESYHAQREPDMYLPAAPFARWLKRRVPLYGSESQMARALGMDPTGTQRILRAKVHEGKPKESVTLSLVDRVLCREGSTHLAELYPALYQFDDDELQEAA
jgi:hypothetical protein